MTTVRIRNSDPSQFKDIQAIVNGYGFGVLIDDGNGLVAVNPTASKAADVVGLEGELLDDVDRNLVVTFH